MRTFGPYYVRAGLGLFLEFFLIRPFPSQKFTILAIFLQFLFLSHCFGKFSRGKLASFLGLEGSWRSHNRSACFQAIIVWLRNPSHWCSKCVLVVGNQRHQVYPEFC